MDNFKIIYRILKYLEAAMDVDDPDYSEISHTGLRISFERWERILVLLQGDGYITGLIMSRSLDDTRQHISKPVCIEITLKGLEYLSENSMMRKVQRELKGIKDMSPGI